jgi:phage terminase large subunit-like protein
MTMSSSRHKLTRGERVCAFIERYCVVPEGDLLGKPVRLEPFQRKFILAIYDNPRGTRRGYLSIARKNAKTATIAFILLAHIAGPEARLNSRIISGAMSKEQAAEVYNYASKTVSLSADLSKVIRAVPSLKKLIGLTRNVEYQAISAEGRTAHGKSPVLAILDEVGQVRGPQSDFVDAIITSQGAYEDAILLAISTQAPNDGDLFSMWLDDAATSGDPRIVSHLYAAPAECALEDRAAWAAANPALGKFRSLRDIEEQAARASRMPSFEPTFRNLILNQRIESVAPFISKSTWTRCAAAPLEEAFEEGVVYGGLDLSGRNDLTALVLVSWWEGRWHVKPVFWTPAEGLKERARRDRAPYDIWADQGLIRTTPSASIDYESVALDISAALGDMPRLAGIAFDRWRMDLLLKEFERIGAELPLFPFGQGFKDMAPAIDTLEGALLNGQVAHGAHPVLTMCMANARIEKDPAGNRKLNKAKATGRIDGAVAFAMAMGIAARAASSEASGDMDGFVNAPLVMAL